MEKKDRTIAEAIAKWPEQLRLSFLELIEKRTMPQPPNLAKKLAESEAQCHTLRGMHVVEDKKKA